MRTSLLFVHAVYMVLTASALAVSVVSVAVTIRQVEYCQGDRP